MSGFLGGIKNAITGGGDDNNNQQQQQQQQPANTTTTSVNPGPTSETGLPGAVGGGGNEGESSGGILGSIADKVSSAVPDGVLELKNKLASQAEEFANEKANMVKQFQEEKKNMLRNLLISKIDQIYGIATNTIGNVIKEKAKDPYMPGIVQDIVDEIIDTLWPDVTTEAKERIISGLAPTVSIDHGKPPCPCMGHILCFFRYYLMPYDRSGWRQLYNPLYWLFVLASLVPVYGIGLGVYILYFFIQDCNDAYGMQAYIVNFKALQFISLGVLSSVIGSVQYYICISQTPSTCSDIAPKEEGLTMIIFVVQIFFIWAAFCFLRSAEQKGGYKFQFDQAAKKKMQQDYNNSNTIFNSIAADDITGTQETFVQLQGESEAILAERSIRRMTKFLIWDIVIFILCAGLTAVVFFYNALDRHSEPDFNDSNSFDSTKNWKLAMSLFWIKAFYGFMSFPFAMLKLPLLNTLISHAKRTGFNWWGNTVPYLGEEEPREKQPWCAEYKGQ